jgi:lipopolysaccharide transport system ATP-binding protein
MKSIIEVKGLSKKYTIGSQRPYLALRDVISEIVKNPFGISSQKKNTFWALKDVSFSVDQGEVIGVIGRNGAGKSTFLKILSRITPPTMGEIYLRGRVASLLEVGTGFHPELTGRENIFLNGAILGMTRREINKKFTEIVDFAEIEKFLDTPVKHYSSGMYMRLAFAIASNLESEILLVDEVLAVGDAQFQKKCLGKMQDITTQEGRTVLFVSHNMSAINTLCSRTVLLEKGKLKEIGETQKVMRLYSDLVQSTGITEIGKRKDRRGNGKCKFTKIVFRNSKGIEGNTLESGDSIQINIGYSIKDKSLKNVDFAMGIDTLSDQRRITSITNKIFGKAIQIGSKKIEIKINKLSLAPGSYSFNLIMVEKSGDMVDWVIHAGTFDVVDGIFYKGNVSQGVIEGNLLLDFDLKD